MQLLALTGAAPDHPVAIDALEGAYLKVAWLRLGRRMARLLDRRGREPERPGTLVRRGLQRKLDAVREHAAPSPAASVRVQDASTRWVGS